jgi:hypothetical protein
MGLVYFYLECLSRAFSGKFFRIEKWSGGLGLLSLLASWYLPIPEQIYGVSMEDLPAYFFLTVFFLTVFVGLVTSPYTIYREEREKSLALEEKRKPRIKVYIDSPEGQREDKGNTSQMIAGNRSTNRSTLLANGLSLVVENLGERRINCCTASLVWVESLADDGFDVQIFEPILLTWDPNATEANLEARIEAHSRRRFWIADVLHNGWTWILRDKDNLAADYQQIFGAAGRYRAIVQVTDGDALSVETLVEINSWGSEKPLNYLGGIGFGNISIIEQESPRLSRPSTEA